MFWSIGVVMRLDKEQISIRIFCRLTIKLFFYVRGEFRLESRGNFLGEISLNCKDVSQIAVVIFRPNMLVVVRVDQLHAHTDAIASPADAAFQKRTYSECFPDFAGVAQGIATI